MRHLLLLIFACYCISVNATTYYVRNDGGTRYSANQPTNRCNGQTDAADTGSGTNQPCAFGDIRYLWADGTAAGSWALAGGDTVIIRGGPWRLGDINSSDNVFNGYTNNGSDSLHHYNKTIPAGTMGNPTLILGENYANCTTKTQLFAGFALRWAWNMQATSFVNFECIELTDHNNCILVGSPVNPSGCSTSNPVSDAGGNGVIFDANSHDLLLQDLNIHGLPSSGIFGPFGANITLTRVRSAFNGSAGWNMDNGTGIPGDENGASASIAASYLTMEWNGCNEEYPIVDAIPAESCYDTNSSGFGDAYSGQDAGMTSMSCDHCIFRYNVKDCFTGPHLYVSGAVTITNSLAHSNMGQCWKWNSGLNGTVLFQNNLTVSDCDRLSAPISGAPSNYNQYLSVFCRADGTAVSIVWPVNGSLEFDNNTFVMASTNVSMDFSCLDQVSAINSIASAGTLYQVNDVLSIRGDFYGGTATVTSVGSGGVITGLSLTNGGTYFADFVNPIPLIGGSGSGATINITYSKLSCNGGPRILRNNIFLGYTNPNNPGYNSSNIGLFCYTACTGNTGTTHDSYWTTRSNNVFFGYPASSCGAGGANEGSACGTCSFTNEVCSDPLFTNEPSQTWTSNSQLDPSGGFNFSLTSGSPAKYAGVAIGGLTNDYNGLPYHSPPSDGALEFVTGGGNGLVPGRQPKL